MRNSLGREIPLTIEGIKKVIPYTGAFNRIPDSTKHAPLIKRRKPHIPKLLGSLDEVLEAINFKDGLSISFHHHLRNGDFVLNKILDLLASKNYKDLMLIPTALFGVHKEIIKHIHSGVITGIHGSVNGPVGREVSKGVFKRPVVLRSHGGRARAIESGDLHIDVAFIAAPSCDAYGNMNGVYGDSACGPLGYAVPDAMYADYVIAITDNLVEYPNFPISISQNYIDYVIQIDKLGDPNGIVSGTTQITRDPSRLLMAEMAAQFIDEAGILKDGCSFQTGAGGTSLAVAKFVRERMLEKNIKGAFAVGGITGEIVEMLKLGLFQKLLDVQSFYLTAVKSLRDNPNHIEMDASMYANPHNSGCVVNLLDVIILGATEIDLNFNVNVNTEVDGALVHGIGGHADTAAGAKLTIIIAPLLRGRIPLVVENVLTITTPGETVDVLVTERGIAINPNRKDLRDMFKKSKLPIVEIEDLFNLCNKLIGKPQPLELTDEIIGVIEYRDGTIIDVVHKVKE